MADRAQLDARAVIPQRILHPFLDQPVVAPAFHVDEVDDDQPGEVAQPQLARHLVGGFQVGLQRGFLDPTLPRGPAGVHVDGDQRFRLVDHQVTAGAQLHRRLHHPVQLGFHALPGEQRLRLVPQDDLAGVRRHQHAHEVAGGAPACLAVHQHFLHVTGVVVADGPLDEVGFLVDQRRRDRGHGGFADAVPQFEQVLAVALDLRLRTRGAGGAHDRAHAARDLHLGGDFLQPAAVGGRGDLAGNAAAPGRVGHQHAEPSGERYEGGQRGALGAALFLDDLHQQDLPAADHLLDLVGPHEPGGRAGAVPADAVGIAGFLHVLVAVPGIRRFEGGGRHRILGNGLRRVGQHAVRRFAGHLVPGRKWGRFLRLAR